MRDEGRRRWMRAAHISCAWISSTASSAAWRIHSQRSSPLSLLTEPGATRTPGAVRKGCMDQRGEAPGRGICGRAEWEGALSVPCSRQQEARTLHRGRHRALLGAGLGRPLFSGRVAAAARACGRLERGDGIRAGEPPGGGARPRRLHPEIRAAADPGAGADGAGGAGAGAACGAGRGIVLPPPARLAPERGEPRGSPAPGVDRDVVAAGGAVVARACAAPL